MNYHRQVTDNTSELLMKQAYLLMSYGHLDKALEVCRQLQLESPDHLMAHILEGSALLALGQEKCALTKMARVVRQFPNDPLARIYYGEACYFNGRLRRAAKEIERAKQLDTRHQFKPFIDALSEVWDE